MDEDPTPKHEGCSCNWSDPAVSPRCDPASGTQCGAARTSGDSAGSLKSVAKQFYDQPIDFKQLEAKGWPGPYVEYTEADAEWWEKLYALERALGIRDEGNRFTDELPNTEESD